MGMLGPEDALPHRPARVLVAGTSGSGKTTLAAAIGVHLGVPHIEIDSLYHGPSWTPRATFVKEVVTFSAGPAWVTEWQYSVVREVLAERADLLVWLDLPRRTVMGQVIRRTLRRRWRREVLWNGNIEPPLATIFTDPDHIVRWAWRTHHKSGRRVREVGSRRPRLVVVRLCSRRDVEKWVSTQLPGGETPMDLSA